MNQVIAQGGRDGHMCVDASVQHAEHEPSRQRSIGHPAFVDDDASSARDAADQSRVEVRLWHARVQNVGLVEP